MSAKEEPSVDKSALFSRPSLSECIPAEPFPSHSGSADHRRGDKGLPSAQYDASISFCSEAQACMARAEEAKLVDPRSCRDWFVRAARCFTLAAQSVSDEEVRVSLALLARSMVVNAMTFGHRSAVWKVPDGATGLAEDTMRRECGEKNGFASKNSAMTPPADISLTHHRVRTVGLSADRVSGISQISRRPPSNIHPAQALLQLEEELARLGLMEQGLVGSHRPVPSRPPGAGADGEAADSEAAAGATNTIADSYLFLSSLQDGPKGAALVPKEAAASVSSAAPPSSLGIPRTATPLTAVSAAATRVATAAAEAMPAAITGLTTPASEWISGWIHKRSPDPVPVSMDDRGGEVMITDGHRVSSDLKDYTVVESTARDLAADSSSSAGTGAEVAGLDPSQSVNLVYSKDGVPPTPPLMSARSKDRVIAEQNLIRMSQTIQRLADENASLARRVEELQGLGAYCNKVRSEIRLFKQEYEGRFTEFKEYLKQHNGDLKMSKTDDVSVSSDATTSDKIPMPVPMPQTSSATEPVSTASDISTAEIERLHKIIVALLNDMKKTKSKLSKQEKVLAKYNLLSEVEGSGSDSRGQPQRLVQTASSPPSLKNETPSQAPAGRSEAAVASIHHLSHQRPAAIPSALGSGTGAAGGEARADEALTVPSLPSAPPPIPSLQRGRSVDAITGGMVGSTFTTRSAPPLSPAATTMRDSLQRQLKAHSQHMHLQQQQRSGTPNKNKER